MIVKGILRNSGVYEGNNYDNYVIYGSNESKKGRTVICGDPTDLAIKVKSDILHEMVKESDVPKLLGHNVDFYYNSYKNVCKVFLAEQYRLKQAVYVIQIVFSINPYILVLIQPISIIEKGEKHDSSVFYRRQHYKFS